MTAITAIRMPKWGLSMTEGKVTHWYKGVGDAFSEGDDLLEVETSKITNVMEAPSSGLLRRIVVSAEETVPVGSLLAVAADETVSDAEIEAFVSEFQTNFTPGSDDAQAGAELTVRMLESAGRKLRVGVLGSLSHSETPVVFVHGFSGDLSNWQLNVDAIAKVAPVIVLDLPGHGQTSKTLTTGSLAELASAVQDALNQLDVRRAHLVGHSLGGAVAMRMAFDQPQSVASLVLIAPAGLPGSPLNREFVDGMVSAQTARQLKPVMAKLFSDPSLASGEIVDEMLKFKRLDGSDEAIGMIRDRMVDGADFRALGDRLQEIPRATVILGDRDAIVGAPDRAALPPDWRVHTVQSGHMPHLERASETNALIVGALESGADK